MTSEEEIDENSNRKKMHEREHENDHPFLLFQDIVILKNLLKYIKYILMRSNLT